MVELACSCTKEDFQGAVWRNGWELTKSDPMVEFACSCAKEDFQILVCEKMPVEGHNTAIARAAVIRTHLRSRLHICTLETPISMSRNSKIGSGVRRDAQWRAATL